MRRVVVTGLGLVTPLGGDVETTWRNLIAGMSGAGRITRFDASNQKCQIACEVKPKDHEFGFDPDLRVDYKIQRSEEHTSELQSLMRISYAVFCLKKKTHTTNKHDTRHNNKN